MSTANDKTLLIMAGGTGGHIFPALEIAKILQQQSWHVVWLGSEQGIEVDKVPAQGITLKTISVKGVRRSGWRRQLLAPFMLLQAVFQAWKIIHQVKPQVVLGFGGFASGPGGIAAWLHGIPLLIHEQNAVAGLTNKLLAKVSKAVMVAFPNAFKVKTQAVITGNPIRHQITQIPSPQQRLAQREGKIRLLVLGGSLGALAINQAMPKALSQLDFSLDVWHQCGSKHFQATEQLYKELQIVARIAPFIDDMAQAYEWADLVVCRAGALTVAELAASGNASILIPYPHAVDDHQTINGKFLADQGAAILLPEKNLTAESLAAWLKLLVTQREKLLSMAEKARELAQPDAADKVVAQVLEIASE